MDRSVNLFVLSTFLILQLGLGKGSEPVPTLSGNYGPDSDQTLDLYVPANTGSTKIIVLVHGGAWIGGDKSEMNEFLPFLQTTFPNYTIANMNYRLGTFLSPGYPKQLEDIDLALQYIKSYLVVADPEFVLFGESAGAHISMLYAYDYNTNAGVKALVDIVGPTDFTDPIYKFIPLYDILWTSFAGPDLFLLHPSAAAKYSPVTYVTPNSPPTIMSYGTLDPVVPLTQGPRLKAKLDAAGVSNELYMYTGLHYGSPPWPASSIATMKTRIANFLINVVHF